HSACFAGSVTTRAITQARRGLRSPSAHARCTAGFQSSLCPLWVRSGHHPLTEQCPLYPAKRTNSRRLVMSALCQKRTPAPQQNAPLFDHLVGVGEQLSNVAGIRANLTICISQAVP